MTAAHVLFDPDGTPASTVQLMMHDGEIVTLQALNLAVYSFKADIAVIDVSGVVTAPAFLPIASKPPYIGEQVAAIGGTQGDDMQNVTFTRVKAVGFELYGYEPIDSMLCDSVTMAGGNSGGPWVNRDGECVGLSSWGYNFSDYGNSFDLFAVGARSINALLAHTGHFPGKRLAGGLYATPLGIKAAVDVGMTQVRGYRLYDSSNTAQDTIVLDVSGYGSVGKLNSQLDLNRLIFYWPSDTMWVTKRSADTGEETSFELQLEPRTGDSDAIFASKGRRATMTTMSPHWC